MKDYYYDGPTDTHPDYFEWLDITVTVGGSDWIGIVGHILEISSYKSPRSNRKPKLAFEAHMAILLWNLWTIYRRDPKMYVGVRMRKSFYKVNDAVGNPLGVSERIIDAVKILERLGLIELRPGNNSRRGYAGRSRCTRIRALPQLYEFLESRLISKHWADYNKGRETIILRETYYEPTITKTGRVKKKKSKKNVTYISGEEIQNLKDKVQKYNDLLDRNTITVEGTDGQTLSWPRSDGRTDLPEHRVDISKRQTFVYRVFNEGSFRKGGRFYGPWWQRIPKSFREKITINGEETVECDYSSLHIYLIYALMGKSAPVDPYEIHERIFPRFEMDAGEQRTYAKLLILTAINAPTKEMAFRGFRSHLFEANDTLRAATNKEIESALEKIIEVNPDLEQHLCSNKGLDLMYIDSEIASDVIMFMTALDIPVLSVHDSFIVARRHEDALRHAMEEAVYTRFKVNIPIK